jgi:hypothetical protein
MRLYQNSFIVLGAILAKLVIKFSVVPSSALFMRPLDCSHFQAHAYAHQSSVHPERTVVLLQYRRVVVYAPPHLISHLLFLFLFLFSFASQFRSSSLFLSLSSLVPSCPDCQPQRIQAFNPPPGQACPLTLTLARPFLTPAQSEIGLPFRSPPSTKWPLLRGTPVGPVLL